MTTNETSDTKIPVLAQLVKLIPPFLVTKVANKTGIKRGQARTFSLWSQLVAMIYSHVAGSLSLNDICDSLALHAADLNSMRNATPPPKRNTLSNANRKRPSEFVKALFWALLEDIKQRSPGFFGGEGRRKYAQLPHRFTSRCIVAVDSTTISLVINCMDWAKHRKRKAAAKMHMALNLQTMLPVRVYTDSAKPQDAKRMHECCPAGGEAPGTCMYLTKRILCFRNLIT